MSEPHFDLRKHELIVAVAGDEAKPLGVGLNARYMPEKKQIVVTANFMLGEEGVERIPIAFRANGSADQELDAIDQSWKHISRDLNEALKIARAYAAIKNRQVENEALALDCAEGVIGDYAVKFRMQTREWERDYRRGRSSASYYPLLDKAEVLSAVRGKLQQDSGSRGDSNKPKLDRFERALQDVDLKTNQMTLRFAQAMDVTLLDHAEPLIKKMQKAQEQIDNAVDIANAIWFKAAEAISRGKPLPNEVIASYGDDMKAAVDTTRSLFDSFINELQQYPGIIYMAETKEPLDDSLRGLMLSAPGERQDKGILQQLDVLVGMVKQPNLLQDAIASGMPKERKR